MKAVGPAGEMPWEFCSRVTHTPFGRKKPKRGQKHLLFRVLFPSQSAGNFLVCRFKGDWRSWWQRLIKHGNPTFSSGSPWAEKGWGWGRPWGQNPTSLPQHLSLAVLGSRQAGLFFLAQFSHSHAQHCSKSWAPAGWVAGMRVGGVCHQIQKISYSPSFATSSSKTDPCAQHFAQDGDHHFCLGVWIGSFYIFILFKWTHMAPGSSPYLCICEYIKICMCFYVCV